MKFSIKRGSENTVVDVLSRRAVPEQQQLLALTTVQPVWMQELQDSYFGDQHCQDLLSQLVLDPAPQGSDFRFNQGILRYKGRLYVGNSQEIRQKIIKTMHESPI